MASTIKKTANALSSESDLLNVYADLKAVCNKFESHLSASDSAQKRILNWAERKEDDAVQEFLRTMYDIESERTATDRRYNDHYRIFVKLWKGIISEKKELNAKLKELDATRKTLKEMQKKVSKAEAKEPQHKVEQRMLELDQAKRKEAEVSTAAAQKLLEVQQDKHQSLRTGYTGLYGATMSRIKDHVLLLEKMRLLVNNFPSVVARNEDGTYVHDTYTGPQQECPIWWQGEQLYKQLQEIQEQHQEDRRRENQEHSARLSELVKKQEAMAAQFQADHHGALSNMSEEQQKMVAGLNAAHAAKVADLEQQRVDLEQAHAAQLASEAQKYRDLESTLSGVRDRLEHQIEEYTKLDKTLEGTIISLVSRSQKHVDEHVGHAAIWGKQNCMNTFLDAASQSKAAADSLLPMLQSGIEGKHEMIHLKLASFSHACTVVLLSAAGAAQASRAENAMNLIEDLARLPEAVNAITQFFEIEVGNAQAANAQHDASQEDSVENEAEPPQPKVIALYPHEEKVQEGFTLVGFEKDDVLILVKRREDGWSRVRNGDKEGWAPTSYMEDYVEEPPASKPAGDGGSDGTRTFTGEPSTLLSNFGSVIDAAIATAKSIQLRDRELAKLSNQIANEVEDKMSAAQQSISDATQLFQRLLAQSKATETGRLLEVNTQLLERALKLELGMETVINSADGLRAALLRTKGSQDESDFNAKHQSWFEALTETVDAVHGGNPMLTEAVRCVLGRKGKHEELQVACRNVTATCAQLAALSKTKKSDNDGGAQAALVTHCARVMETGGELLAAARESQDLALASVLMEDFTELTANQAKRLTMATQVQVLKLEKDLEREREKLGRLRKLNYD